MLDRRLIVPDDPAFETAAREVWDAHADLREVYPDPQSDAYAHWIAVNGVLEGPEIFGPWFPPVPPRDLRQTGCGGAEAQGHLFTGYDDFEVVVDTYETFAQRDISALGSVLDFGSGCGRLLRWFDRATPKATLHGIDVRKAGVDWCAAHLRGEFVHGPFDPPSELETDAYDLVVALSLFSHFTREANLAWLRELTRVCKPDGLMLLTTHGAFSLAVLANSPEHQQAFRMEAAQARDLQRRLRSEGFHYHEMTAQLRSAIEVGENYGQAFLDEHFVDREWAPHVEVLGCIPARLFRFQDVYVLRPRRP